MYLFLIEDIDYMKCDGKGKIKGRNDKHQKYFRFCLMRMYLKVFVVRTSILVKLSESFPIDLTSNRFILAC